MIVALLRNEVVNEILKIHSLLSSTDLLNRCEICEGKFLSQSLGRHRVECGRDLVIWHIHAIEWSHFVIIKTPANCFEKFVLITRIAIKRAETFSQALFVLTEDCHQIQVNSGDARYVCVEPLLPAMRIFSWRCWCPSTFSITLSQCLLSKERGHGQGGFSDTATRTVHCTVYSMKSWS